MLRSALLITALLSVPALAKELKGVKMPDTVEVAGKTGRKLALSAAASPGSAT